MESWSCRHQDGEGYCQRLRVGCRPGTFGCVLRGKTHFTYDEEGRAIPWLPLETKKERSRRARNGPA